MFSCRAMLCILNLAVSTNHHMLPPFCRHRVRHACMYVSRLTLFFSPLLFLSVVVSFHNFHIRECLLLRFTDSESLLTQTTNQRPSFRGCNVLSLPPLSNLRQMQVGGAVSFTGIVSSSTGVDSAFASASSVLPINSTTRFSSEMICKLIDDGCENIRNLRTLQQPGSEENLDRPRKSSTSSHPSFVLKARARMSKPGLDIDSPRVPAIRTIV